MSLTRSQPRMTQMDSQRIQEDFATNDTNDHEYILVNERDSGLLDKIRNDLKNIKVYENTWYYHAKIKDIRVYLF